MDVNVFMNLQPDFVLLSDDCFLLLQLSELEPALINLYEASANLPALETLGLPNNLAGLILRKRSLRTRLGRVPLRVATQN